MPRADAARRGLRVPARKSERSPCGGNRACEGNLGPDSDKPEPVECLLQTEQAEYFTPFCSCK